MFKLLALSLLTTSLLAWDFTKEDLANFSPAQMEVITTSILVGETKGYGLTLAAISIVENMARMKDTNNNHICGPHQVDINYSKAKCKTLESNAFYSAKLALNNLLHWEYRTYYNRATNRRTRVKRSWRQMIAMYCVGYTNDPHGPIYANRVAKAYKILKENLWKNNTQST